MTVPNRLPASFARGLRSVERIPGGALLYHVVFGNADKREPLRELSFSDLDSSSSDRPSWPIWAAVVVLHLVLIGVPMLNRVPDADPEPRQKGMNVELVSVPTGGGKPDTSPRTRKSAVEMTGAAGVPSEVPGQAAAIPVPQSAPTPMFASSPAVASSPKGEESVAAVPIASVVSTPAPASANVRVIAPEETRWEGAILERIVRKKRYPSGALHAGLEGTAMLRLRLDRDGKLIDAQIARSAGHGPLDEEVLALARRSSPFPRPPAAVVGDIISLVVPVEFLIRKH